MTTIINSDTTPGIRINQNASLTPNQGTNRENTEEEEVSNQNIQHNRSRDLENKIRSEVEKVDLEVLLLNTLKITAIRVQEDTDKNLINKPYISIFCFTEIKVDSIDFIPIGLKLFTKHRGRKEKKGGLAIGHLMDSKIKLEEI